MILVTGATGMVGAAITRQLVAGAEPVRILRRPTSQLDLLGDAADRVDHALGDITDPESLTAAMAGVRWVYHIAAFIGMDGQRDDEKLFRVNVEGTANVVNAALAAGVERLVHTSSIAALGRTAATAGTLIDETAVWQDSPYNTRYAISKYQAELEVQRGIAEGLGAVMVNPSLIFGLGREGENTRRIVDQIRQGKLPAVPAGGINAVDVRDVADGLLRAMAQGRTGERYLLVGENLSWRALVDTLAEAFGVKPPRLVLPPLVALAAATAAEAVAFVTRRRPPLTREVARISARTYWYSHRKAVEELGCHFRPFRETALRLAGVLG